MLAHAQPLRLAGCVLVVMPDNGRLATQQLACPCLYLCRDLQSTVNGFLIFSSSQPVYQHTRALTTGTDASRTAGMGPSLRPLVWYIFNTVEEGRTAVQLTRDSFLHYSVR